MNLFSNNITNCCILIGLVLSLISVIIRSIFVRKRFFKKGSILYKRFKFTFYIWLISNVVATCGFYKLINSVVPNGCCNNYSSILTVLSILAAGACTGFWSLNYQIAIDEESLLLNFLSAIFLVLFYILFDAICFYIGKTKIEEMDFFIPAIIFLLLTANTIVDNLDYRITKRKEPEVLTDEQYKKNNCCCK